MENIKFKNIEIIFYTNKDRCSTEYSFLKQPTCVEGCNGLIKSIKSVPGARLVLPSGHDESFKEPYSRIDCSLLEDIVNCGYEQIYFPIKMRPSVVEMIESMYFDDARYGGRALSGIWNKMNAVELNTLQMTRGIRIMALMFLLLLLLAIVGFVFNFFVNRGY